MLRAYSIICVLVVAFGCKSDDGFAGSDVGGLVGFANGCEGVEYPDWQTSRYVLPFPVGRSYTIGLSHCSGSTHAEGEPDQFAIDIIMNIGTMVTAVEEGTIMFVEESGNDFEELNNMVVLRDEDGFFHQYQHLTQNGAFVEEGDFVQQGDPIGLSGASGLAGFPHLHFVTTRFGDWMFPYSTSYPITFRNTSENPKSLIQGEEYEALPY